MRLIDLTGKRFEYLTVLGRATNKGKNVAWCCSHSTIIGRLKRGWTVESAVTTPPDPKHKRL